ncbi:hypothetical protein Tco_0219290, partial [Tanacetum coccineum]
ADRSSVIRKEKELSMKIKSLDALKSSNDNPDSTIENLEQQLQQIINENNELEIRMEEAGKIRGKTLKQSFRSWPQLCLKKWK